MDATVHLLHPVAIGLHTRDRQDDYHWFAEVGPGLLTATLEELHRGLIADQDARPASTFILVDQGPRLGLLVANLKTARQDHLRTHIDDTLLLEFDARDRETVFRVAAGLLAGEASAIQQKLLHYAEARFQQKQATRQATVEPLAVPAVAPIPGSDDLLMEPRVGLRSTEDHQRRVAGLLHSLADRPSGVQRPFIVVSTGFVGRDKLQQQAVHGEQFIALTRSSSFPADKEVAIGPGGGEKKKARRPQPRVVLASLGLVSVLGIALLGGWLLLGNRGSNSPGTPSSASYANNSGGFKTTSADSARKSQGSETKLPGEERMANTRRGSLRAATVVGMGATPHAGGGPFLLPLMLADQDDAAQAPH
jgi:hypothetical protein